MAKPDTAGPDTDPVVTDADQKKRTALTAGQAFDWMLENRCAALEDEHGGKVRMLPGFPRIEWNDPATAEWKPISIVSLAGSSFFIVEPGPPKLPDGCEWTLEGLVYEDSDAGRIFFSRFTKPIQRDIYAALVEEFDMRPKERRDG